MTVSDYNIQESLLDRVRREMTFIEAEKILKKYGAYDDGEAPDANTSDAEAVCMYVYVSMYVCIFLIEHLIFAGKHMQSFSTDKLELCAVIIRSSSVFTRSYN